MDNEQTNDSGEAGLFEGIAAAKETEQQVSGDQNEETVQPTEKSAQPAAQQAVPVEGQQAAPAWAPNFKVKAFKKEYEIPEMYRGLAKDAETEKQLKEVFTKYHSFDDTRAMYDHVRKERDEYAQKYSPIHNQLERAANVYSEAVKSGNFHKMDQVLEILGLHPDHVMQYAIEKAKLEAMDPAQRDLVQGKLQAERQAQTFQEQQQEFQSQLAQQQIQLKKQEFDLTMAQPQVSQLAETFQSKFGMDFQDEVVAAGEYAFAVEKRNISVAEAIQRVAKRYNLEAGQTSGNAPMAQSTPAAQGTQTQARVPVKPLPNIKANNGSSPVGKPKVSSLDDLKKMRDEAFTS